MGNEKDDSDSSVKVISDKSSRDRKKEFKHKKLSDNHNSDSSVEVILDKNPKDKKKELKRKKHNDKYKSDSSDKSSKEKKKEVKHKKYNDKYNSDSSVDEITDKSSKDKRTEFQRKKYIDKYNSDSSIEEIGEKISSKDENKESKRKKYREESNSSAEENNEKNLSKERNKDSKRKKYDDDIEERSRKPRRTSPRESRDYNRRNRNDRYEYHRRNREYKRMMNYRDLDNPREEYPRYWGSKKKPENKSDDEINEKFIGNRYYGDDKSKNRNSENKNQESDDKEKVVENDPQKMTLKQKKTVDLLTTKTGGAYIPPAKLRMMQAQITDKSSVAYQRISWEALKKSIHGYINKVNVANIRTITRELLRENIVRGRGLLCKSIIQAQAASPTFTHVYAALVSIINSKFPNIGELLLKRLVLQFKRGFKRNDKSTCISSATFVAHLVNQRVAHEILALEILTLLVESPTDDSVEVAIAFLKESGQKLTEVSSKGINAIFEMLRNILHEGQLDKRVQYMIEVMFQIRKDGFKDHVAVMEELDIVEEDDQFTHLVTLDDVKAGDDILNVFRFDGEYLENEDKYKALSKEILGSDSSSGSEDGSGESSDEEEEEKKEGVIIDNTETNLLALRRTIYLTIQSSLDFEECAHKLMKMQLKPGQESELCHMFLDCCAEQRTYEKFYGLLAQRFCQINRIYVAPFEQIFRDSYSTLHRLDINKLRNVSKFFAHLLFTDAISWDVLNIIKLNKDDTTSSSRIFIKIVFQELAEYMGLSKLNERLKDQTLQESFAGIFPRDNPKNTRFAINFFTSIGLGGLTDELREHLKSVPTAPQPPVFNGNEEKEPNSSTSSDTSSSSSSSDSSSSSNSSDSDSSSSSEEERKKRKKNKNKLQVEKKTKHIVKEKKSKEKGHNKKQKKSTKSRKDKR